MKNATVDQFLLNSVDLDELVHCVLKSRLSANRVTTGKLACAVAACDRDGRLREQFVYHGAHTGRWTSRQVQLHNLPRPHDDINDLGQLLGNAGDLRKFRQALPPTVSLADGVSSLIRPCVRAAPGKEFVIADFASIEPRGVAWCAGEVGLLNLFSSGGDAYCDFAAKVFGQPTTRAMKRERNVGNQAVVSCGDGIGANGFDDTCKNCDVDLAAVGLTPQEVVEAYRDAHPAIAGTKIRRHKRRRGGLWNHVELAATQAITLGITRFAGRCAFSLDGGTLVVRLPSGRRLSYRKARIESRVPGYCSVLGLPPIKRTTIVFDGPKEKGVATYGGRLTENIVQAICRDLLVAAMLECERNGLPIVMHVHDEVVAEVPVEQVDESLRQLLTIMSTPPPWAEGFPIEVEGFVADRYFKTPPSNATVLRSRNGLILTS